MSVIGTTLKQPRVFAHDAVALKDLPGCTWRGIASVQLDEITTEGSFGTGFVVGGCYNTYNETSGGQGAKVLVASVNDAAIGDISEVLLCEEPCTLGNAYNQGDVLTVIWEPKGAFTEGTDCTGKVVVGTLTSTGWDYGCAFTPIGSRFDIPDFEPIPEAYNPMRAFRQKDIVRWQCDEETCPDESWGPGAALYIGYNLELLTVIMESGNKATYYDIPAGSFMPISCFTVCAAKGSGEDAPEPSELKEYILALF